MYVFCSFGERERELQRELELKNFILQGLERERICIFVYIVQLLCCNNIYQVKNT